MKRFLLVLLVILLVGGGFGAWWYLRDTPQKVLTDAANAVASFRSAKSVTADVAVTDLAARTTTGFSFAGQIDASDPTLVQVLGDVRIGAQTQSGQDETVDVVLDKSSVLLHPNDVAPERLAQYHALLGDASGTAFLLLDRSAFLRHFGYAEAIAGGKSGDIRTTLLSLLPTIAPKGALQTMPADGYQAAIMQFTFTKTAVQPFLIALVKSWTGKTPTADEYAWVERISSDLSRGTFSVSLDAKTRQLTVLAGDFPILDSQGNETKHARFTIEFSGVNAPVTITAPKGAKDITASIQGEQQNALPGAEGRTPPAGSVAPEPLSPADRQVQIDMFSTYQEQIKKKKSLY